MSNIGLKGIHQTARQYRIAVGWEGQVHVRYLARDLHGLEDAVALRDQLEASVGKPRTEETVWYNRQNGHAIG
ncbi:hypothetical protein LCGC14_1975360 [marine sediment metagenome]|uniref:Uncharacterized protein n=1 Tax=marine sediment metagenome TaxID=412755 RepID=A0A0F9HNX6_9ZZZZ